VKRFLGNIFKKKTPKSFENARVARQLSSINNEMPKQIFVCSGQSVGKQREVNEDGLFTISSTLADGISNIPFGICVIADGMGGHLNGELASGAAVRSVLEDLTLTFFSKLFRLKQEIGKDELDEILVKSFQKAQEMVLEQAPGGGTTLTVAIIINDQVTIAHLGDSRAYFLDQEDGIRVLTRDHSYVNRLLELGKITTKEAAVHPQRNVLYRALGQTDLIQPEINTFLFPKDGYLILCSDGLWGVISEVEIQKTIHSAADLPTACQNLVHAANQAGGPDNISVILCQLRT
jgi:PPM family protein phosphatase